MANSTRVCTFEGCGRKHKGHGLCNGHYQQRRSGRPLAPLSKNSFTAGMSLEQRFNFYVDKQGDCHIWTGATTSGYGILIVDGTLKRAHRLSYELKHGAIPPGMVVDHICHVTACVNPDHLRAVTQKQNVENIFKSRPQSNGTSGVRGVSEDKATGKWFAAVNHHGKRYYVGRFVDVNEAAAAVLAKRMELFTHSDGR